MMKICAAVIVSFLMSTTISWAAPIRIAFDESGTDLASVSAYVYHLQVDGTSLVVSTTCALGTGSLFTCTFTLPTLTPGRHTFTVTAMNGPLASDPSAPFTVTIPAPPRRIRKL